MAIESITLLAVDPKVPVIMRAALRWIEARLLTLECMELGQPVLLCGVRKTSAAYNILRMAIARYRHLMHLARKP